MTVQSAWKNTHFSPNHSPEPRAMIDRTVIRPLYQDPNRLARTQPVTPVSDRGGGQTGAGPVLETTPKV